jgi:hypothetical protein
MTRVENTAATDVEPEIEQKVHTDELRIRKLLVGAFAVIGPIVLLAIYYKLRFPGLTNPDALDFAQFGRNIAHGRGFTTLFLRPLVLTHGADPLHQPEVVHGPLFGVCLAIAFAAFGAKDSIAAGVSSMFFLLTIPAVYLLGKRKFGARIGTLSALVFTLSSLSLEYATSGLHLSLCILLVTCLMIAVHQVAVYVVAVTDGSSGPIPRASIALTGVLTALLYRCFSG